MTPGLRSESSPVAPSRRWLILGLLMALCFISHFNRACMTTAGDERIMKQFQLSPQQMGTVYTAFLLVYTLFMIPAGMLIDRKGPRLALTAMAVGSAIFCGFTGLVGFGYIAAEHVWISLLLVRSLMGLMSTPLHPGAARAIGGWFEPGSQAFANGIITGSSILAYAVVHVLFGSLMDRVGWPRAFLITGAMTFLLACVWFALGSDRSPSYRAAEATPGNNTPSPSPAAETSPERTRSTLWLTASYAAVGYFQYLFFYWMHFYFDEVLKMDKEQSRYLAGLPNLAMAMAMPLGGFATDFLERHVPNVNGRALLPKLGMFLSAGFLTAGIVVTQQFWIVTFFTLSLGCLGLCESSFWTTAVEIGRERGGTTASIMNAGGNGLGLVAPIATPFIGQLLGWKAGILVGAAVAVLGALCWFGIRVPSCPVAKAKVHP